MSVIRGKNRNLSFFTLMSLMDFSCITALVSTSYRDVSILTLFLMLMVMSLLSLVLSQLINGVDLGLHLSLCDV